jgi:hypothetical protein
MIETDKDGRPSPSKLKPDWNVGTRILSWRADIDRLMKSLASLAAVSDPAELRAFKEDSGSLLHKLWLDMGTITGGKRLVGLPKAKLVPSDARSLTALILAELPQFPSHTGKGSSTVSKDSVLGSNREWRLFAEAILDKAASQNHRNARGKLLALSKHVYPIPDTAALKIPEGFEFLANLDVPG